MAERAIVLYDGQCGLCSGSVRRLRALDWRKRLDFADVRDAAVQADHPGVDPARALARMHLVLPGNGRILDGYRAFRWMAGRLPILWPMWPWLWIPGAVPLGNRVYDWVARNRFAFGTCGAGACDVDGTGLRR
jgi:predicted DCC family thiol-disulfide oxidoreductase YuxK